MAGYLISVHRGTEVDHNLLGKSVYCLGTTQMENYELTYPILRGKSYWSCFPNAGGILLVSLTFCFSFIFCFTKSIL